MWKSSRPRSPKSRFPYPRGRAVLLALPVVGLSALIFFQSVDPPPTPPASPPIRSPDPTPAPTPPRKPVPAPEPVAEKGCPEGCSTPPPECAIKGNISFRTGERIYHLPGQELYDRTVIEPGKGERWFCTEDDAEANGWRRTKR